MSPLLIAVAAFVGVAALVGSVAMIFRAPSASRVENRLDLLTGANTPAVKEGLTKQASVLAKPLDAGTGLVDRCFSRFGSFTRLFEQADTSLTLSRFLAISTAMALAGSFGGLALRIHPTLLPVLAALMALMPTLWLWWRRRKRLKAFAAQLPDALEMLSRALRAGQSLPAGFSMVASEMSAPVGKEFGRVFEEQNLGRSLEEALESLTERVPNVDLRFFATAVILQRQTGGDLAEILDKIGRLIRERFQIWGQIQALTGEGRLSGVVLLALPLVLFFVVYQLNPDYVMLLFQDPLGTKMLAGAAVMQVLGALVIRKIVNIQV
jgi:tight adherence protein B